MVEKRVSTGSHPQSEIQGRKKQSPDCFGVGYIAEYGEEGCSRGTGDRPDLLSDPAYSVSSHGFLPTHN